MYNNNITLKTDLFWAMFDGICFFEPTLFQLFYIIVEFLVKKYITNAISRQFVHILRGG